MRYIDKKMRFINVLSTEQGIKEKRQYMKNIIAGTLVGVGLAAGFLPILIASLLVRHNLYVEILDRMDDFWKTHKQLKITEE